MSALLDRFFSLGIIPVIALDDAADTEPLCMALADGGLPAAEITFRTKAAEESIKAAVKAFPGMLVGAGTVTGIPTAIRARDAGAQFIVTPGFNPEVVSWCLREAVPVLPGCTTASEVEAAMNMGLDAVKFFPAEQSGGLAKIRALNGPYPGMRFMPTGGIHPGNIESYLSYPKIIACGGSFMVPHEALLARDWSRVEKLTRQAVAAVHGAELAYAGPVRPDASGAREYMPGQVLARLLGRAPATAERSAETDASRRPDNPARFRLGIAVTSLPRTKAYCEALGARFDEAGFLKDTNGALARVTLRVPESGFELDLLQRGK